MNLFKNILIPIDNTPYCYIAFEKALEFYESSVTFHLMYVVENTAEKMIAKMVGLYNSHKNDVKKLEGRKKLNRLSNELLAQYPDCNIVKKLVNETDLKTTLQEYIAKNAIDLVISYNKPEQGFWHLFPNFDITRIDQTINCAILTVTAGCLNSPIKSILLPVGTFFPERRINLAIEFAKKYRAHIHLVTSFDDTDHRTKDRSDALYQTYKTLQQHGLATDYKVLNGIDTRYNLLQYAQQIKADALLVNPEKKESAIGFTTKNVTNYYHSLSALHIFTIQPSLVHA